MHIVGFVSYTIYCTSTIVIFYLVDGIHFGINEIIRAMIRCILHLQKVSITCSILYGCLCMSLLIDKFSIKMPCRFVVCTNIM